MELANDAVSMEEGSIGDDERESGPSVDDEWSESGGMVSSGKGDSDIIVVWKMSWPYERKE